MQHNLTNLFNEIANSNLDTVLTVLNILREKNLITDKLIELISNYAKIKKSSRAFFIISKALQQFIKNNSPVEVITFNDLIKKLDKWYEKEIKPPIQIEVELNKIEEETKRELEEEFEREIENLGEESEDETEIEIPEIEEVYEYPLLLLEEEEKLFDKVREKLRKTRIIHPFDNIIVQHPVLNINISDMKVKDFLTNKYVKFFSDYFNYYINMAHDTLWKSKNVLAANIQAMYYSFPHYDPDDPSPEMKRKGNKKVGEYGLIKYTTPMEHFSKDIDPLGIKWPARAEASGYELFLIGYRIVYYTKRGNRQLSSKELDSLKAFKPSSNRKFHDMTTASTSSNKMCIYETFMELSGKLKLNFIHKDRENFKKKIKEMLANEGKEIETTVKNGELIKSLELLTKKYKNEVILGFFGANIYEIDGKMRIETRSKLPLLFKNGKYQILKKKSELKEIDGKKMMLYDNCHVAPSIFTILEQPVGASQSDKKKNLKFSMEPKFIELDKNGDKKEDFDNETSVCGVLGFDFETKAKTDSYYHTPYCATLFGQILVTKELSDKKKFHLHHKCTPVNEQGTLINVDIKKAFYGEECIKDFVKYLDYICTKYDTNKSRQKKAKKFIHLYGFNNSRFDNLTEFYKELHKKDSSVFQEGYQILNY